MAPGRIRAHMVSIMPKLRTVRYIGIMPPEKKRVTVTMAVKNFRPEKVLRASGYAHRQLIRRLTRVPTTVYTTVFFMYMNSSPRTRVVYVCRVILRGMSVIPPFMTSRPWLMEVMNCRYSGYRHTSISRKRKV